jgi:outer membrane receptor protein involved in Fe transport
VGLATNAVQEVSVSSGTFSAEYGGALSGVVNYVTKDGGSKWTGGVKHFTGDHYSSHSDLFFNIDKFNASTTNRTEASLGGPLVGEDLKFYGSGVYNWYGGHIYAQQLYSPYDSYLSREGFPSGDPRRGPSTAPLYFGPLRNGRTDSVGLPGGDGNVVALNWSRSYNLQGNLTYRIVPEMKLKYEVVYDNSLNPLSNSAQYRFRPDGRSLDKTDGYFHTLELTHTINDRMFYTLKGAYATAKEKQGTFDDPYDPRYLPVFYQQVLPGTNYLTGGTDLDRFSLKYRLIDAKLDLVAQLFSVHELKLGAELRSYKFDVEAYTLGFKDPNDASVVPSFFEALNGRKFVPRIPSVDQGYVGYGRKPLQFASYVQDKIELSRDIILNLGLRYEYFDPSAKYNPLISQEYASVDSTNFYDKNLQDVKPKQVLSPRVSISYPITDRGTIRFSYGHFYQMGNLATLFTNPTYRALLGTTPTFGNANVEPQKSVQYELGFQQGLTDNLKVEFTGYYKDVRDYIYSQLVQTARGDKPFYVLTNLSYANTRGISVSLLKRRASVDDLLSATIDYTFQIAEGNRTQPAEDLFFNEQNGQLAETYLVPFDFDRSHTVTTTATLTKHDDWSASLIGYVRAGTAYTPAFPSNVVPITFVQNSDRQAVQWNVDLKLEKFFSFGGLDYSLFLLVDNLFDTQNELTVYASTGRALYAIDLTQNANRFADLRRRINNGDPGLISNGVLDNYYANPRNISTPRLVRVGASVNF